MSGKIKEEISDNKTPSPVSETRKLSERLRNDSQFQCDALLCCSAAQLTLAFLVYFIAIPPLETILFGGIAALVIIFSFLERDRGRRYLIIRRILTLSTLLFAIILTAVFSLLTVMTAEYDPLPSYPTVYPISIMISNLLFPVLLIMQTAIACCVSNLRKFDIGLIRFVSILSLAVTIFFCTYVMQLQFNGGEMIITRKHEFPLVLFGFDLSFTVAIDNFLTRILMCASGAAVTVLSFIVKSSKKSV